MVQGHELCEKYQKGDYSKLWNKAISKRYTQYIDQLLEQRATSDPILDLLEKLNPKKTSSTRSA